MDQPLPPADTADLDLVNQVGDHLATVGLLAGVDLDAAWELLARAACDLAAARIAHGLLRWKADGGYDDFRRRVANEQWDVVETTAIDMCLRSVVTALDLCAAALFRLGGADPGRSEVDLGRWGDAVAKSPLTLPSGLQEWAGLRDTEQYQWLRDSRNEATHRRRRVCAKVGDPAAVSIVFGGDSRPVLDLTGEIGDYGRHQFRDLCQRLLAWAPEASNP